MIFECSARDGWRLLEPGIFTDFKVVLRALTATNTPALPGLAFESDTHARVDRSLPARMAGDAADSDWHAGYDKMLVFAARHGWVDERGGVRAHIEWTE